MDYFEVFDNIGILLDSVLKRFVNFLCVCIYELVFCLFMFFYYLLKLLLMK